MRIFIFFLVLFFSINVSASKSLSYGEFLKKINSDFVITFVEGIESGISMTNTFLDERRKEDNRIFCTPDNFLFFYDNIKHLIIDEADYLIKAGMKSDELEKFPVSLLLLRSLEKTFPCN